MNPRYSGDVAPSVAIYHQLHWIVVVVVFGIVEQFSH